jgi:hypothetical protein
MMNLGSWSRRKRLLWSLTGVLIIVCGATATIWMGGTTIRTTSSRNDCTVVEQVGRQWIAMARSVTALENGPGEREDLIAIADSESAMSDKISAAAGSVSAPALKDQLNKWAQGAVLSARTQRDSANRPPQSKPPPGADADFYHAAVMTHEATAALLQACPNIPRVPPAN